MMFFWTVIVRGQDCTKYFPMLEKHPVKYHLWGCYRFLQTLVVGMLLGAVLIGGAAFFLAHGTEATKAVGSPLVVALLIGFIVTVIGGRSTKKKK